MFSYIITRSHKFSAFPEKKIVKVAQFTDNLLIPGCVLYLFLLI